jgi:ribose-phosphate pyrophosphokinase
MALTLVAGSASAKLAEAVGARLGVRPIAAAGGRFPDGEARVVLERGVRGQDVYVVQSTGPPADANLVELLLTVDACRRAGAARVTAVAPYLAYQRQDRRTNGLEPLPARLVADMLGASGVDRVVAVHLHNAGLESAFGRPLEHLSAVGALADALRERLPADGVVVAPDLGAAKLADAYGRRLGLPTAVVHKTRLSAAEVRAGAVVGDVAGRSPILVDDMISTGGTVAAALDALAAAGARPEATVVATHGLLVGPAAGRLARPGLASLVVTDSVEGAAPPGLPLRVVSLAPLLADAVDSLHGERPLGPGRG